MEPRKAGPGLPAEHMPMPPSTGEMFNAPEVGHDMGHDARLETVVDAPAQAEMPGPVPVIPVLPGPVPVIPDPAQQAQGVATDAPATAADEDLIEKEWVDKAKEIVARTQGDPHAKSNELTGLKKEYIQKRYGKTVAIPKDQG